ncbi:Like Sm protein 4 [Carabus blaptoides fortunei]
MNNISRDDLRNIINLCTKCIQKNNYEDINIQAVASKINMNLQEAENMFGLLLMLLRGCKQLQSYSDKEFYNYLTGQNFRGEFATNFLNILKEKRDHFSGNNNYIVQIESIKWRIDISLRNNTLKQVFSPFVIWKITLCNGEKYTVEINIKKFHAIRFNLATLLKELGFVKSNSLVKK